MDSRDGRRRARWISPLVTVALALFVTTALITADPVEEDRAERIGKQVRCPACEGESIAESPSSYAADMMVHVRDLITQGLSDSQILDRLSTSYPDSHLLDPPLEPSTILLWALPAAALGTGAVLAVSRLRRPAPPPSGGDPP